MDHYQRARAAAATLDDKTLLTMTINSIGAVHHRRGDYEAALRCFAESERLCRAIGHERGLLFNLKKTGETQIALGRTRAAISTLAEALSFAERLGEREQQCELHQLLATALEQVGEPATALVHFRRYATLNDELFNESRSRRIRELEIAYETERKDREIERLEQERQLQRRTRDALAIAVLLSLALVLVLVSRYRLKERAAREMRRLSRTDPLTGLPNRRAAGERLADEGARLRRGGRPCAVAMADIDDFKRVNDRHGHDRGDAVLVRVAQILRGGLREQDLVGRWGGEEFLLVLPDTTLDGGRALAEKLRELVARSPLLEERPEHFITLTVGVAEMTAEVSVEESVRRADHALLSGKSAGKDRVVVWSGADGG
jgi:diguanylate cyclase (GGDEF)-like protein